MVDNLSNKRKLAHKTLDDFKRWHMPVCGAKWLGESHRHNYVDKVGELELDALIEDYTTRNEKALMQKLSENNG
jgi:hypothetical protein